MRANEQPEHRKQAANSRRSNGGAARPAPGTELLAMLRDPALPAAHLASLILSLLRIGFSQDGDFASAGRHDSSLGRNEFLQRRSIAPRRGKNPPLEI